MLGNLCMKISSRFLYRQLSTAAVVKPKVFLDVVVDGAIAGRMVFELATDVAPRTAENFRALCTGENGFGYMHTNLHRIVPGFVMQAGDITAGDGSGGRSIYGRRFGDENFILKHDCRGVLSMANSGPNSNGSQFLVTFDAAPSLDGKHVVFGKLIQGGDSVLNIIEAVGSGSGNPTRPVFITDTGEIESKSVDPLSELPDTSDE